MTEVDDLKTQISKEWLGRDGVNSVGVELDGAEPVVVIGLIGEDEAVTGRLRMRYARLPVRIRAGQGPITPL